MLFSSDVENLLSALENIGVITSSAHTAVNDNANRHCLRCHQPYRERDNSLRSCIIPHHVVRKPTGAEAGAQAQIILVTCCADLKISPNSDHFTGRHTTLAENVVYKTANVRTCVEKRCSENVVIRYE